MVATHTLNIAISSCRYQALTRLLPDGMLDPLTPPQYRETLKAILLNVSLAYMNFKEWALAWNYLETVRNAQSVQSWPQHNHT